MRRRRKSHVGTAVLILAAAALLGRGGAAQTVGSPSPLEDPPAANPLMPGNRVDPSSAVNRLTQPAPPAPEPIPGPASAGIPVGGMDAPLPQGLPINLATAMQLAGVRPLDIATATAQVRQSLALLLQAKALWIPNINGGIDYFRHDGYQQNIFTGALFLKGRQSFFTAGGPTLTVGLADAIFAPLAARRVVAAREADLQASRNDALYTVSQAFFDLQSSRGRLLGLRAAVVRAESLVNFTSELAPSLVAPLEINRAKTELQSLRQNEQLAVRDWRVASARLAEVLLLDPATLLQPIEPPFLQVTLIREPCSPEELTPVALNNRPELASRRELVAVATQLLRQEKSRPFLPTLYVLSPATATGQLAAGNFAAGPNGQMSANNTRFDIEVAAVWQLQNGGVGNVGRIRQRRAELDVAAIDVTRIVYRVRSEVSQAVARLQTARIRVVETEEGVRQAVESADKNFIGLRETTRPAGELLRLVVRPQEVVQAIEAMYNAYQQYAVAVNEYNVAQFELYRALGQPAQWVTSQPAAVGSQAPAPCPPTPRVAEAPGRSSPRR